MTLVRDTRKYFLKTLIFLVALLTLLSFGYLVQAEEAKGDSESVFADTVPASSESSDTVGVEEEQSEVETVDAPAYEETGIASWYGDKFHGRRTANGERYNMHAFTAAHKSLPFGTILRVTNLSNNKSILVRVNDRGPFVRGRIIDLSRAAAGELDLSLSKVKIEQFLPGQGQEALGFRSDFQPIVLDHGALESSFTTDSFTEAMKVWKEQTQRGQHALLVMQPDTVQEPGRFSKKTTTYRFSIGRVPVPVLAMR